jgi:hypothetical protein
MAVDNLPLNSAEQDNETSWYKAFGAGLVSGAIKIPEGIVSLGAELIDLGADSDTAADVEEFFDKINPFEEVAEERTIGKLTEAIVQIGVPGGIAFKTASNAARRLTTKALKAKRTKAYAQFGKGDKFYKSPIGERKVGDISKKYNADSLRTSLQEVNRLNKKLKYGRYSVAVLGGAAGETMVVDNDEIGTFGDMFDGPTMLSREENLSGREDAVRKLMNRIKFGSESILLTPVVSGVGSTAKSLAKRGKDLAYSNKAFDRWVNKYIRSQFSPTGNLPDEVFAEEMSKQGLKVRDSFRAKQIVGNITKTIDGIFPVAQEIADKSIKSDKLKFTKQLNEILLEGNLSKGIDETKLKKLIQSLDQKEISKEMQETLLNNLNAGRFEFNNLVEILNKTSKGPTKTAQTELKELFKNRLEGYTGNTFKIFEHKSNIFNGFSKYKPTDEAKQSAIKVFRSSLARENKDVSFNIDNQNNTKYYQEAREIVDNILKQAEKIKTPKKLPDFTYITKTMEGTKSNFIEKSIGLSKSAKGSESEKRALRELFGEVKDPRFTLFNGITNLSLLARTSDYLGKIAARNAEVQAKGQRGFFWGSKDEAIRAVDQKNTNIEIVQMNTVLDEIDATKDLVNPLSEKWTTREIGEAIKVANDVPTAFQAFVRGEKKDMTGTEQAVSFMYRNLLLFPKGISQMAKTIFSIPTHIRNFMSAGAFTAANGIMFDGLQNPKLFKEAFQQGIDVSGLLKAGAGSKYAQKEYQDMIELGIANSSVQLGDMLSLLKDSAGGIGFLNLDTALGRFFNKFKKGGEFLQNKYMAEDDTFKITNFVVELDRIIKSNAKRSGMSLDDFKKTITETKGKDGLKIRNEKLWALKKEASEIVKNTVPNYAYVGQAVKTARLLPIGNFMSFPSEIIRTSTNIARQGVKEMSHQKGEGVQRIIGSDMGPTVTELLEDGTTRVVKNNAITSGTYGTGMKRIAGMATTLTAVPIAATEGAKALYDVTEEEIDAMRRFVPDWSKNSTLIPVRLDDGELRYIDFSKSNAYDLMARPFRTLMNNLQDADVNGDTLLEGFSSGVIEASGEIMNPFISESIWTEAMSDLFIRSGRTSEGKQLYTDQTAIGDKLAIQFMHLGNALAPSYKQGLRIGQASFGVPDKRGETLQIGPELAGFMGLRPVKVDPMRAMEFKIAQYQGGIRNSRREFTGGVFGLLKGGPVDENDVISRYIASNKARFKVQQEMFMNLEAAQVLGETDFDLRKVFKERQISSKNFNKLSNGQFDSYYPSDDIRKKFREIAINIDRDNPFLNASPTINEIKRDFRNLNLDERFRTGLAQGGSPNVSGPAQNSLNEIFPTLKLIDNDMQNLDLEEDFDAQIDITDYIEPIPAPMQTPMQTPMPSAEILQQAQAQASGIGPNGLTPTENALLSEEEKQIRLRSRGLA